LNEFAEPNIASTPPPPPRAMTKNARRRSWAEPRVRNWWMLAIVIFLISLWFVGVRVYGSQSDRWLIHHGVHVEADIIDVDGNPLHKIYEPDLNLPFHMTWRMPDGKVQTVFERLKAQRQALGPGKKSLSYVDPNNPNHWTDRTKFPGWKTR
jgi:cell division septal protein FtsQ